MKKLDFKSIVKYFNVQKIAAFFAAPALILEDVADPTGAGDSFAGGLVGYLARAPKLDHATLRRAMLHGTATASFCVESLGPAGLWALTPEDVNKRVAQIRDLYRIDD